MDNLQPARTPQNTVWVALTFVQFFLQFMSPQPELRAGYHSKFTCRELIDVRRVTWTRREEANHDREMFEISHITVHSSCDRSPGVISAIASSIGQHPLRLRCEYLFGFFIFYSDCTTFFDRSSDIRLVLFLLRSVRCEGDRVHTKFLVLVCTRTVLALISRTYAKKARLPRFQFQFAEQI